MLFYQYPHHRGRGAAHQLRDYWRAVPCPWLDGRKEGHRALFFKSAGMERHKLASTVAFLEPCQPLPSPPIFVSMRLRSYAVSSASRSRSARIGASFALG